MIIPLLGLSTLCLNLPIILSSNSFVYFTYYSHFILFYSHLYYHLFYLKVNNQAAYDYKLHS